MLSLNSVHCWGCMAYSISIKSCIISKSSEFIIPCYLACLFVYEISAYLKLKEEGKKHQRLTNNFCIQSFTHSLTSFIHCVRLTKRRLKSAHLFGWAYISSYQIAICSLLFSFIKYNSPSQCEDFSGQGNTQPFC